MFDIVILQKFIGFNCKAVRGIQGSKLNPLKYHINVGQLKYELPFLLF